MTSTLKKGGGTFKGIKLLLCENPLPPLNEAIAAAETEPTIRSLTPNRSAGSSVSSSVFPSG